MAIPVRIKERLRKRNWKNKDTCWVIIGEYNDWFIVFHSYEAYLQFKAFIELAEKKNKKLASWLKLGKKKMKEVEK